MDIKDKEQFLATEFTALLRNATAETAPAWGKLSLQGMVEHFTDYTRIASGKEKIEQVLTPEEHISKSHDFLRSDKPFRPNTPNALMGEEPAPLRHQNLDAAIDELQHELDHFFAAFRDGLTHSRNPFFGDLNYELNVHLLYKHALHHLRQFGLVAEA